MSSVSVTRMQNAAETSETTDAEPNTGTPPTYTRITHVDRTPPATPGVANEYAPVDMLDLELERIEEQVGESAIPHTPSVRHAVTVLEHAKKKRARIEVPSPAGRARCSTSLPWRVADVVQMAHHGECVRLGDAELCDASLEQRRRREDEGHGRGKACWRRGPRHAPPPGDGLPASRRPPTATYPCLRD